MTRFRQALLDELLTRVADPADQPTPAPAGRPRRRHRLVLAAGGAVVLAVGGAVAATQATTTPAYAVSKQPDGSIVVTFNHLADPGGVNRALREAGVRAVVLVGEPAKSCPVEDRGTGSAVPMSIHAARSNQQVLERDRNGKVNVARLRPEQIPAATVLVIIAMDRGPRDEAGPYLRIGYYREPGPTCAVDG